MGSKKAEEYTKQEILEWVGAGPKREGKWELTEEQLKLFLSQRGIIHYKPGFRYTKWTISSNGYIQWEPTTKREFEAHIQEPSFSQETIDDHQ